MKFFHRLFRHKVLPIERIGHMEFWLRWLSYFSIQKRETAIGFVSYSIGYQQRIQTKQHTFASFSLIDINHSASLRVERRAKRCFQNTIFKQIAFRYSVATDMLSSMSRIEKLSIVCYDMNESRTTIMRHHLISIEWTSWGSQNLQATFSSTSDERQQAQLSYRLASAPIRKVIGWLTD